MSVRTEVAIVVNEAISLPRRICGKMFTFAKSAGGLDIENNNRVGDNPMSIREVSNVPQVFNT